MQLKTLILIAISVFLVSCGETEKGSANETTSDSTQKEIKKSPSEYANEYCECMQSNPDKLEVCEGILAEVVEKFGEDNKEAEKEFSEAMSDCLR